MPTPTRLFEAAAFQYTVKATCKGCGHVNIFQPHALWWKFHRKGWDDRLRRAGVRFRCLRCQKTGAVLEPSRDEVTIDSLPLPPETEWKRMLSRFRC